jgi:hypothetical protein
MIAQIGNKLRVQIHYFSGKLSFGLCKSARRFVEEMILGIQARGSVRLSEIGRSLEESVGLKKIVERLSRNLNREGLRESISEGVLREGSKKIDEDSLLIVDTSDLIKKYATKMEYLAEVRDGSEKKIGNGYWTCQVVGVECGEPEIVPLYHVLYSQDAPDFISENNELLKAMRVVSEAAEGRGIFVLDRGGDRDAIYKELVPSEVGLRFIIRLRDDRHVLYWGKAIEVLSLAQQCKTPYLEVVLKEEHGKERKYFITFGFLPVRLAQHPDVQLWLVVIKGFGQTPLMLLTNLPMRKKRDVLWWVVEAYITRWRVEDTIRFIKQSYQEEDVRVMSYERLRNMASLVLAASFFAAVYLGQRAKLEILGYHVLRAAKRIFGIPDFRYYALADGIKTILTKAGKGVLYPRCSEPPEAQLSLFPLEILG